MGAYLAVKGFWSLPFKSLNLEAFFHRELAQASYTSISSATSALEELGSHTSLISVLLMRDFFFLFLPLLAYISGLEGGGQLAGRDGQFSPASRAEAG